MRFQKKIGFLAGLMVLSGFAYAGNATLAQTASVPAGERVANYLQAVMSSASEVVNAQNPGDIFSPKDPYRLGFDYDPERQVIDIYMVGNLENIEDIKSLFEFTQKLVLRLNDKIQKFYGVTLKPQDLSIDYLSEKTGKVIVKFENGKYLDKTANNIVPTPAVSSVQTNN